MSQMTDQPASPAVVEVAKPRRPRTPRASEPKPPTCQHPDATRVLQHAEEVVTRVVSSLSSLPERDVRRLAARRDSADLLTAVSAHGSVIQRRLEEEARHKAAMAELKSETVAAHALVTSFESRLELLPGTVARGQRTS